jgi:hypothetical protein
MYPPWFIAENNFYSKLNVISLSRKLEANAMPTKNLQWEHRSRVFRVQGV